MNFYSKNNEADFSQNAFNIVEPKNNLKSEHDSCKKLYLKILQNYLYR